MGDIYWNIILSLIGIMLKKSYGYEGGSQSLISALFGYGLWERLEFILNFPLHFVKNRLGKPRLNSPSAERKALWKHP